MSRFVLSSCSRRSVSARLMVVALGMAVLLAGLPVAPAMAVPLSTAVPMNQQDTSMWITSDIDGGTGTVTAADYASDGTLYIGGDFTHVGPPTGGFGAIGADGRISGAYPYVDGTVYASVADGSGGFYIGGDFDSVGGVAPQNLARISADGTLGTTWNPGANSVVYALAIDATYVYAGGNFSTIGGQSRGRLAHQPDHWRGARAVQPRRERSRPCARAVGQHAVRWR